jgi:hypothetical protein
MSQGTSQSLNWEAPGGRLLKKFIAGLPKDRPIVLNVFGSFPLQLKLDPSFLSGDVDLFSDQDFQELAKSMGLAKGQSDPFIEIVPPSTFIATPVWRDRADKVVFGNVTVYLASPLDVLVGKIKRLDPKDLDAFDLVKAKTGGPSEEQLKQALRDVVDIYRPAFDEENPGGDAKENTRRLWQHFYGHDIDVGKEIIQPGVQARAQAYGFMTPPSVDRLRKIASKGSDSASR